MKSTTQRKSLTKKLIGALSAAVVTLGLFGGASAMQHPLSLGEILPSTSVVTASAETPTTVLTNELLRLRMQDDGTFEIIEYIGTSKAVTIPSEYNGVKITRIGDGAFCNKPNLQKVNLSNEITYIGEGVFDFCPNLQFTLDENGGQYLSTPQNTYFYFHKPQDNTVTSFSVKDGTEYVAAHAFSGCENIQEIILPSSVKHVGYKALGNSKNLESVTLPFVGETGDGVTNPHLGWAFGARTLGGNVSYLPRTLKNLTITGGAKIMNNAFYGADMIESLTLPYIGESANATNGYIGHLWGGTSSSGNVNMPASVKNITLLGGKVHNYAFYECPKLETVNLTNGVMSIGYGAFYSCSSLKSVEIGSSVTSIGNSAFCECSSLTSIEIGNNVTSIGNSAFRECSSLTSVEIGNNVTSIGEYAFSSCRSLTSVHIFDILSWSKIDFGSSSATPLYYGADLYLNGGLVTTLDLSTDITEIKPYVFYNCRSLTSVKIPNSVTSIGDSAFYYCGGLTSVEIPNSVTSIGISAFYACGNLTSVDIPNSVTTIGGSAFSGCTSLTSVEIPDLVTSVESSVFYNCSSLTSVEIGNNVTSIGNHAFYNCSSLTSVEIGNNVTSIGNNAFYNCSSLTSVKIPNSVTNIGSSAFYNCSTLTKVINHSDLSFTIGSSSHGYVAYYAKVLVDKNGNKIYQQTLYNRNYIETNDGFLFEYTGSTYRLIAYTGGEDTVILPKDINGNTYSIYQMQGVKNVIIPDGMTSIGSFAFADCSSLMSVVIPNSVTSIDNYAFKYCSSLTSIIIPNSVKTIGNDAFYGCSSLTSVEIPNSVENLGERVFCECSSLTSITIGDGVTSIGYAAFLNNDNLTQITISPNNTAYAFENGILYNRAKTEIVFVLPTITEVVLPYTLTTIGAAAFISCSGLTNIVIPNSVITIEGNAFRECSSLVDIIIPDSVTSIGDMAFYDCFSLTNVSLGKGVTSIGYSAFGGCSNLTEVKISSSHTLYTFENGILYNKAKTEIVFVLPTITGEVVLPSTLTSIGDSAFEGCGSLTTIVIPNSVTSIGASAFEYCRSLTTIVIPDSVTSIGDYAFEHCSGLTSVEIGSGVTSIGASAFEYCSSLTTIVIPNSITSIGASAFKYCRSLTSVEIGDGVTSIVSSAFRECSSLTEIKISPNNKAYTFENGILYNTAKTKIIFVSPFIAGDVVLSSALTSIDDKMFYQCDNLTSIVIGDSVKSIGREAFYGCSSLKSVEIGSSVTSIGNFAFEYCSSLAKVINHSDLFFTVGSSDNGYVAYYANVLVDRNGDKTYKGNYIETGDGFLFEYTDNEYRLIAYMGEEETVTLPENINGNAYSIYQMRGVKNVIIPDGVTSIADYAFDNCSTLTSVIIPNSVTNIGYSAFAGCGRLTSVEIPDSVTRINFYAFAWCSSLTHIVIPNSVTSIDNYAFKYCSSLTSIIIPNSVKIIGNEAFYNCSGLTSVIIPNSVELIGSDAFYNCSSLTNVYISNIGAWGRITFNNYTANPLYNGANLYINGQLATKLVLSTDDTEIKQYVFYGCGNLTDIILPNNLRNIGSSAFANTNLTLIYDGEETEWRHVTKAADWDEGFTGTLLYKRADSGLLFETDEDLTEFYVSGYNGDSGYTTVNSQFSGRYVVAVYDNAFSNNEILYGITLPDTIISIGDKAFANCINLRELVLPDGITEIAFGMLEGCDSLESLVLPFMGETEGSTDDTHFGYIFGAETYEMHASKVPESLRNVTLNRCVGLPAYAFYDCQHLETISLPASVGEIGAYAFYNCDGLIAYTLPNSVTWIGEYAFADCDGLTAFELRNNVTAVGENILKDCNNLQTIAIGTGLTEDGIEDLAFDNPLFGLDKSRSRLRKYIVADGNPDFITDEYGILYLGKTINGNVEAVAVVSAPAEASLSEYNLPNYIVNIYPYAFAYNRSLLAVELEYVREIGAYAFYNCDQLYTVVFSEPAEMPADVLSAIGDKQYSQRIGDRAFMGCDKLFYVDLGVETIKSIGEEAFLDCVDLKTVNLGADIREIGFNAFGASNVGGSALEQFSVDCNNVRYQSIEGVLFEKRDDGTLTLLIYPACKPVWENGEIAYENAMPIPSYTYALPLVDDLGNQVLVSGIESYAFRHSKYLTDLTVESACDLRVGDYAFADSHLQHVYIGDSVVSLGLRRNEGEYTVFANDMDLVSIDVAEGNGYYSSIDGVLFNKDKTTLVKYPAAKTGSEYVLPKTVETIASMAFKENKNVALVTVQSDLLVVGLEAFYDCSNLQTIYFNHAYAPRVVMENAFTTNLSIHASSNETELGYTEGYYENGVNKQYGWKNYDGVYNIQAYTLTPEYQPETGIEVYYAVMVVDSAGRPLDNVWVSLTDYKGVTETVKTVEGIAMFYQPANAETWMLAIDFDNAYALKVYDEIGNYYPYQNDYFYLDGATQVSYVALTLEPSMAGVSCNGEEINSEAAEINKACFDYEGIELIDPNGAYTMENTRATGIVRESIDISVIVYLDKGFAQYVTEDGCWLTQNGECIPECLVRDMVVNGDTVTFVMRVPVYRLIPETPILAQFTMQDGNGNTMSCETYLNVNVIDFEITQDDIHLESEELSVDLSGAGEMLTKLMGTDSFDINLGKKTKMYIGIDGSTITVGIGVKNSKESGPVNSYKAKEGYEKFKQAHNKGSYFFQFHQPFVVTSKDKSGQTIEEIHYYTYNIRFVRDTRLTDYYYYRCYIYEGAYANEVKTVYGKVNGVDGVGNNRDSASRKAQIIYLYYASAAQLADNKNGGKGDITKGKVYEEEPILFGVQESTKQSLNVSLNGELQFQYNKSNGLTLTAGEIKGSLSYTYKHNSQFMVWVIPVTLEVEVGFGGEVTLKLKFDDRKVSVDEATLQLTADVKASLGVGCQLASAGVYGKVGVVFIFEFYPDLGVDYFNVNGDLGVYAQVMWWKKDFSIWNGSYDIIDNRGDVSTASMSSLYMISTYERITPEQVAENAKLVIINGNIYKIYYVNAMGKAGYDENNFMKLALAKWNGEAWEEGVLIDDNGLNDGAYSLYSQDGKVYLVYTQRNEKITVQNADDVYANAENFVVKYVELSNGVITAANIVPSVTDDYKYLQNMAIVDGIPTIVWAENADNNMFGVSPDNYIDANGKSHVFATTSNSIWVSQYKNDAWMTPVTIASNLSAITDLLIADNGDIYYIVDTNGDLADTEDRVLYCKKANTLQIQAVNDIAEGSVTHIYAESDGVVYYYISAQVNAGKATGLYRLDTQENTTLILPVEAGALTENYQAVKDENGNLAGYIFTDSKTWKDGDQEYTGDAIYGIFYDGEWGQRVELIDAEADIYVSSFDFIELTGNRLFITFSCSDRAGVCNWQVTQELMVEEKVVVSEYELDYREQSLLITLTNNGAKASAVYLDIDGNKTLCVEKLQSGETKQICVKIGLNKNPIVQLYADDNETAFAEWNDLDFTYSDLSVETKQLILGGKNVLLVAVKNGGNLATSGTLYIKAGENLGDKTKDSIIKALPIIKAGGISYVEIVLSDFMLPNSNMYLVYVESDGNTEKGNCTDNNITFATFNPSTGATGEEIGCIPELNVDKFYTTNTELSSNDIAIAYRNGGSQVVGVVCGTQALNAHEYSVNAENDVLTISSAYLRKLTAGQYAFIITFMDEDDEMQDCVFTLHILDKYTITWVVEDEDKVTTWQSITVEGTIPLCEQVPTKKDIEGYTFKFIGWDINGDYVPDSLAAANADVTYVAVFELVANNYEVIWSIDGKTYAESYEYGQLPAFNGRTKKDGYTLVGWDENGDGEVDYTSDMYLPIVTESKNFVAIYEEDVVKYQVIWSVNGVEQTEWYEVGAIPAYKGSTEKANDERYSYAFVGWDKQIVSVSENVVYTALYEQTPLPCTVEHRYGDWYEISAATCEDKGLKRRDCQDCNYYETCDIEARGHDKVQYEAKPATCTESGWKAYETCSRCDYTTYSETPALGHDTVSHQAKAATCTEIGWDAYEMCTRCDYSTYQEIATIKHDYEAIVTVPTCTEEGYTTYTCFCGENYISDYVSPNGHVLSDWIVGKEATFEEDGYQYKECMTCGNIIVDKDIPALEEIENPNSSIDFEEPKDSDSSTKPQQSDSIASSGGGCVGSISTAFVSTAMLMMSSVLFIRKRKDNSIGDW